MAANGSMSASNKGVNVRDGFVGNRFHKVGWLPVFRSIVNNVKRVYSPGFVMIAQNL